MPKLEDKSPTLSAAATANQAKQAVTSHIFTYTGSGTGHFLAPQVRPVPSPPVRPKPQVVAAPPVQAHPTGTSAEGVAKAAKPAEVDEKAAVLRTSANRTYK